MVLIFIILANILEIHRRLGVKMPYIITLAVKPSLVYLGI